MRKGKEEMKGLKQNTKSFFAGVALLALLLTATVSIAKDKDKKEKPPGPATKMKIIEVFPTTNYTVVKLQFMDSKGKVTTVKEGTFSWWSNFLNDRRKPAKQRQIELSKVNYYKKNYTLKLVGFKKLCPPRVARLRITFDGTDPKKKFRQTWTKKATCR